MKWWFVVVFPSQFLISSSTQDFELTFQHSNHLTSWTLPVLSNNKSLSVGVINGPYKDIQRIIYIQLDILFQCIGIFGLSLGNQINQSRCPSSFRDLVCRIYLMFLLQMTTTILRQTTHSIYQTTEVSENQWHQIYFINPTDCNGSLIDCRKSCSVEIPLICRVKINHIETMVFV